MTAFDAIPAELRERDQWVCWREEKRDGKPTKVPYRVDGRPASTTDPATWTTFGKALTAFETGDFDGLGFAFSASDPYCGIDLDDCLDPLAGLHDADADAGAIIGRLDSYTEESPSGLGIHVIVKAQLDGGRRRPGPVEMYDQGRYFTITGRRISGTPATIEPRQAELDAVRARFLPEPAKAKAPPSAPRPVDLGDRELLDRAFAALNGADVRDLYQGRWHDHYGSQSEADLALARHLAFWAARDAGRIDSLFRSSGLMRPKWDERRGATTYGARTVETAIAGTPDTYQPRSAEGAERAVRMDRASTSNTGAKEAREGVKTAFLRFPRPLVRTLRPPDEAAFTGFAGRIVDAIAPTTEASPTALLVSLLTMFGNAVGPRPHVQVGPERHRPNLFSVLVGASGTGRKGMAMSHAEQLVGRADTDWCNRVVRGLVSGEGVIWHVRDPVVVIDAESGDEKTVEEGAMDKRLLVREDEFASVLAAMGRDGSTLSGVLRDAWDGRRLQTLAKRSPAVATGAHVSILAAITQAEARRKLTATEQANGFANRFLWVHVERSRLFPDGAAVDEAVVGELGRELAAALAKARKVDTVLRDDDAKELWREEYPRLTREVPGMSGAMRSRAESQTLRLSLAYALLDGERLIRRQHVAAAIELWEYAERSLFHIFGDTLGDSTADRILAALRDAPAGLTRTEITDVFNRHAPANEIERALGVLAHAGFAFPTRQETGGRPVERWYLVTDADEQEDDLS